MSGVAVRTLLRLLHATVLLLLLAGCLHADKARPLGSRASESRDKGFREARSTRAELEESFAPQRWAVVIGVPSYADPSWSRLKFATKDADEVARVLKDSRFGRFHRVLIFNTADTTRRDSILFELRRLKNDLRRQDTFVFYFSGHGSLELSRDGTLSYYLAASDTRANDLWGTGIELSALREFLDELRPQRKVMVLDNCFAGSGKSQVGETTFARLRGLQDPFRGASQMLGQSDAVLMASTLGGIAQEDDRLGHGTYTYYLLQALTSSQELADSNSDGAVTVYEAHDFARIRTVERTQNAQVPEGYFRTLGEADMYLSGQPSPALSKASSLVYAYGIERGSGMTLSVDGRAKGTFPRTIPIDPGRRRVTIADGGGRVLADGDLEFEKGRIYPISELMEELQGYRRFLGVEVGGMAQRGPAEKVWGSSASRVALTSGYRVRQGAFSGLALSLGFGWTPIYTGEWQEISRDESRTLLDAGARLVWRRPLGPLQAGAGWQVQGSYTSEAAPLATSSPLNANALRLLDRWLTLSTGPVLWQGYALNKNLLIGLEERASWFYGSVDGSGAASSFQGSLSLGVEMGF